MTLAGLWLPCRLPLFCSRISVPMGAPCDASDSRESCLLWCALCDVISIDASHDGWDPYDDLVALLPHARCGAAVLFDDTFDARTAAGSG